MSFSQNINAFGINKEQSLSSVILNIVSAEQIIIVIFIFTSGEIRVKIAMNKKYHLRFNANNPKVLNVLKVVK